MFVTFVAGILFPGLGYWLVDKRVLAISAYLGMFACFAAFSWTRFILEPAGFWGLIGVLVAILLGSATHAAFLQRDRQSLDGKLRTALIYALCVGMPILLLREFRADVFGYETYRQPSYSMGATLNRGDYLTVDTWRYNGSDPAAGDIVVFTPPGIDARFVNRVIALPGDIVSLQENTLTRNGETIAEPYAIYEGGVTHEPIESLRVPEGEYLLLGDNRNRSRDSRFFGTVPRANIVGVVANVVREGD